MNIEQRFYDKEDLLIGEPDTIQPGRFRVLVPRISGFFTLPNGETPDFYVEIAAACHNDGNEGHILFQHPITGATKEIPITARNPMHRFEIREDDGTPGAIEWHLMPNE